MKMTPYSVYHDIETKDFYWWRIRVMEDLLAREFLEKYLGDILADSFVTPYMMGKKVFKLVPAKKFFKRGKQP